MLIFGVTFDHSFHSNISSNMQKKITIMYPLVIQKLQSNIGYLLFFIKLNGKKQLKRLIKMCKQL
jgi:hypothetical protein